MSPQLEANCLLLSANVSYENAVRDLQRLTGVSVDYSTQQRLVHRQEFAELEVGETVTELSIDGGKARLRTEKGQVSEWGSSKKERMNE